MSNIILYTKTLREIAKSDHDHKFELNSNHCLNLGIPDYQRDYEWKSHHVRSLLKDTYDASVKNSSKPYLMGTLILHHDHTKSKLEIVDGQQRLITLSILLYCLSQDNAPSLLNTEFDSKKSVFYIKNTQAEINAFLSGLNKQQQDDYHIFILDKLNFSVLVMSGDNALDQAYTFFDSINSKGKGLSDFDLIKAHHLMFIPDKQESLARKHNDFWNSIDGEGKDNGHHLLFGHILRRIRMWSRGEDRDNNEDRSNFYAFISVVEPNELELTEHRFNCYMQPNVFRSWYRENDEVVLTVDHHKQSVEELLPIQITQNIEGGDAFFIYAKKYHQMYELLFGKDDRITDAIQYIRNLSIAITNGYLKTVFQAAMLLYYDKFGEQRLIEAATCTELIISDTRFQWSSVRPKPVRIDTTLSKVKSADIIPIILNTINPSHVVLLLEEKIIIREFSFKNMDANKGSRTLENYWNSVHEFYKRNSFGIGRSSIVEKLFRMYKLDRKE